MRTPVDDLARVLTSPPIAKQLKARGLDTDALAKQLGAPPAKVNVLRNALNTAQRALEAALRAQKIEDVARLQHAVDSLYERLVKAEQEWLDSLV
jgi:beta-lactamase class A